MSNSYSATPGIVAGALTVNGPITSLSDAGIRIGAAAPFVRLFKGPLPNLGLSYNLGTDEATRDNAGLGADELVTDNTVNALRQKYLNAAGTVFATEYDRTIAQDGTAVTQTGDTVEHTLKTKLIPGNTLGPDGGLIVEAEWTGTVQGGVASLLRFRLPGFVVLQASKAVGNHVFMRAIITNQNATGNQHTFGFSIDDGAVVQASESTPAVDTTLDQNLTVTFQGGAATDNWTLNFWRVHAVVGRTSAF